MNNNGHNSRSIWKHMASAGFSGCITECIVLPVDTVKARLMMDESFKGSFPAHLRKVVTKLWRERGLKAFYKGLAPGLHRQILFGSTRIGLYDSVAYAFTI